MSSPNSESQNDGIEKKVKPPDEFIRKEEFHKNYYFDNEVVEKLLHSYLKTACTEVKLRDEIMIHASELIRQIIKAHNLGQIYPGKDDSSIGDLFQTAWCQLEGMIYKYEALPYCSECYNNMRPNESLLYNEYIFEDEVIKKIKKCPNCNILITKDIIYYKGKSRVFNLWSQVSRTVILAYIKKENRDRKNSNIFKSHLENRPLGPSKIIDRFLTEAQEVFQYNDEQLSILESLKKLHAEDEKAHEGLVSKLMKKTGYSRTIITNFLKMIRLRGNEFTDSPNNEQNISMKSVMESDDDGEFV